MVRGASTFRPGLRRPIRAIINYLLAPLGIAACFLLIPQLATASALLNAFTTAGVACGIYYPYSMAYGIAAHPEEGTQMAGLLVGPPVRKGPGSIAKRILILDDGFAGNAAIACSPGSAGGRIICAMAPS